MSKPIKKNKHQRNLDTISVARAESKLAKIAADYVQDLLACEMNPSYVPIKSYIDLVDAESQLSNCLKQQKCSMVVDAWPRTEDGGYVFDDMTLASCYDENTKSTKERQK